ASYNLAPIGNGFQFLTTGGLPLNAGQLFTYAAGTSTPQATYTTSAGSVANANPIILGVDGRTPSEIWLTAGVSYKFVLEDSLGNIIATYDNLTGINDVSVSASEWSATGYSPTYIGPTSFSVPGDHTATYQPYRRIKAAVAGGSIYGSISTSVYAAGVTTVTLVMDSTNLDNSLTAVDVSFLSATNPSVPASLNFSGPVTVPTPTFGDNSTKAATTAFLRLNQGSKIQPVSASIAANALTLTLNQTTLDFRSTTLTDGTVNTRTVSSAIFVVVPSGATLGCSNSSAQYTTDRLVLLAIDNAGTVELAVVNLAGGNNLDETTLISTTAISAAATASNVIYSTTARTNVPFRVVGMVTLPAQTVAGTWATGPSLVQGIGGMASQALSSGRTWQAVTGSRALGTTYYNMTGRDIEVNVAVTLPISGSTVSLTVNGVMASRADDNTSSGSNVITPLTATVPKGGSYIAAVVAGSPTISNWAELR
ncbi:MAG TPA: hypothetical protein VIY48_20590, partial [Candidatus Paceibacterota bacterium]